MFKSASLRHSLGQLLTHAAQRKKVLSGQLVIARERDSFGQPRFPETINQQLCV